MSEGPPRISRYCSAMPMPVMDGKTCHEDLARTTVISLILPSLKFISQMLVKARLNLGLTNFNYLKTEPYKRSQFTFLLSIKLETIILNARK